MKKILRLRRPRISQKRVKSKHTKRSPIKKATLLNSQKQKFFLRLSPHNTTQYLIEKKSSPLDEEENFFLEEGENSDDLFLDFLISKNLESTNEESNHIDDEKVSENIKENDDLLPKQ